MFERSPDVLIAGAGPVGQFAALCLTLQDVPVQIVDTGVWPCQHSYALALHPSSLQLFDSLGLGDRVRADALCLDKVCLYDAAGRKASIHLPAPGLAVVRQDALERLLESELEARGVRIQWRHEVAELAQNDDAVSARVLRYERESRGYIVAHSEWVVAGSKQIAVPWVIGADGYNSRVRRALGFDFAEVAPASYYAVFEFKTGAELGGKVRLVLGDNTNDVLWPLPNGGARWSFELPGYLDPSSRDAQKLASAGFGYIPSERPNDKAATELPAGMHLDEESLQGWLEQRAPWFTGDIDDIAWSTVVRFERRRVPAYGQGRLWLAGDSAHLTGPAGVQSMNAGLAEAFDLAQILGRILRKSGDIRELEAYNDKWSAVWRQLHAPSGVLTALPQADPWVVSMADRLPGSLPAFGDGLAAQAADLGLAVADPE